MAQQSHVLMRQAARRLQMIAGLTYYVSVKALNAAEGRSKANR